MATINFRYNFNTDETKIKTNFGTPALPDIHRLDFIQDALGLLGDLYNQELLAFRASFKGAKARKKKNAQAK